MQLDPHGAQLFSGAFAPAELAALRGPPASA
jgi:hypothetical protein